MISDFMVTAGSSIGDVSLTPEQLQAVQHNGTVEIGPFHLAINHDFVRVHVQRPPLTHELAANFRVLQEVLTLRKSIYALVIVGKDQPPPTAEQRRLIADWESAHGSRAVAMVGSNNPLFAMAMNLVFRALNVFRAKPRPFAIFATEEEVKAWLDVQRSQS